MVLLDENILESQRQLLRSWRLRVQQIGRDVGPSGIQDEAIIALLHQLRRPTLFTRDLRFYDRRVIHAQYCLVVMDVGEYEAAIFTRHVLRHPSFNQEKKRMGTVVRISHAGIRLWRLHGSREEAVSWPSQPR